MGTGKDVLEAMQRAFREKSLGSKESVLRVAKNGTYLLDWKEQDVSIKVELLEQDSIGLMLQSLVIEKDFDQEKEVAVYLKNVADKVEKRVSYLMEGLKVIELETTTNALQMRSENPDRQDDTVSYFELIVKSGKWFGYREHLSFHRYEDKWEKTAHRHVIPFSLTKQQFERLLDDLIAAL